MRSEGMERGGARDAPLETGTEAADTAGGAQELTEIQAIQDFLGYS